MQPIADLITDRKRLKAQVTSWRALAVFSIVLLALVGSGGLHHNGPAIPVDYIAQITIEGVLTDDPKRDEIINDVLEDPRAKAVIVKFDSPGGTTYAGEEIYLQLKELAAKKPVVGVMGTLCASACYMSAMGVHYAVAREGTLTGSIGVLMQSMEVSRLADKLGITPITIKSGAMKDVPSLTEPMTEEERKVVAESVTDAYDHFVRLIVENRKMDDAKVRELADGRIYTGNQAVKLGLVDGLGGIKEAKAWLQKERKISPKLEIQEIRPKPEYESLFDQMAQATGMKIFSKSSIGLDGLVSIWHPALTY